MTDFCGVLEQDANKNDLNSYESIRTKAKLLVCYYDGAAMRERGKNGQISNYHHHEQHGFIRSACGFWLLTA